MAAKITSASNRNKRKTNKPVTQGQNPQRANRQRVSNAQVSSGDNRSKTYTARVTNASERTSTGRSSVTGGERPQLPPGKKGGAIVKNNSQQSAGSARRDSAQARLNNAAEGTQGGTRVGQPSGSANRMYGAQRVNEAVARAEAQARSTKAVSRGTLATSAAAALLNAPEEIKKAQRLAKNPGGAVRQVMSDMGITMFDSKATPKPQARPERQGPTVPQRMLAQGAGRSNAPSARPQVPSTTRRQQPEQASGGSTSTRQTSAPRQQPAARQSEPQARRQPSTKPSTAKQSAEKVSESSQVSGIGPVKDGQSYASKRLSIQETLRELREMRKRSQERQKQGK